MSETQSTSAAPTCRICGGSPTIKAHLIPQGFVREIKVDPKSNEQIMLVDADNGPKRSSKSGAFATDILCGPCDNKLGVYEGEALKLLRRLRRHKIGKKTGTSSVIREKGYPFRVRDTDEFIRFACGIIWKYAAVSPSTQGRITEVPFFSQLADVCFHDAPIPDGIDVAIERDLMAYAAFKKVTDVNYYRTPSTGRLGGRRMAWFSLGGFIIYVRLDEGGASSHLPTRFWMRGKKQHHFQVSMRSFDENADVGGSIRRVEGDLARLNARALAAVRK